MAFYISGPKLLFETTEISTHPNSTQQESNYIYLYTTKFGTSIKIRLNRKFESTEFETMRVNCITKSYILNIKIRQLVTEYALMIKLVGGTCSAHSLNPYAYFGHSWSYFDIPNLRLVILYLVNIMRE